MIEALINPLHVKSPDGQLWGFFNMSRETLTASKDGYLVTVPAKEAIWRLQDFSLQEEQAFWDFNFSMAAEGINNPAKRGLTKNLDDTTAHSVVVGLNDGHVAWQSVGTVHSHIIWNKQEDGFGNIRERLIADRTKVAGTTEPYLPLAYAMIDLSKPDYTQLIRYARHALKAAFTEAGKPDDEIGFSHYTETAHTQDPRIAGRMIVELWTEKQHSIASFSRWARYWNGISEKPVYNEKPEGYSHAYFRPAQP